MALVGAELDRTAQLERPVERADDAHVGEALFGGGLGIAVVEQAIGEVEQLRRELVALGEAPLAGQLAVERQPVLERPGVVVGRIDALSASSPFVPTRRYSETSVAPKLAVKLASRSLGKRSTALTDSSTSPSAPAATASASTGSSPNSERAALMQ